MRKLVLLLFAFISFILLINTSLPRALHAVKTQDEAASWSNTESYDFGFIKPLEKGVITQPFGENINPFTKINYFHKGIQISTGHSTPVHAAADGKVIAIDYMPNTYGLYITIKHDNGFITLYARLGKATVKVGDEVKKGHVIGNVGSYGDCIGPRLYFETIYNELYFNPLEIIPLLNDEKMNRHGYK